MTILLQKVPIPPTPPTPPLPPRQAQLSVTTNPSAGESQAGMSGDMNPYRNVKTIREDLQNASKELEIHDDVLPKEM